MTATWHNDSYSAIDPHKPELSVKGKTVIVTGASSGIGRETAEAFAAAGASSLILIARREDALHEVEEKINSQYPSVKVTVFPLSITDDEKVAEAAKEIGKWDVLIMNAGYMSSPAPVAESRLDEWWRGWEACSSSKLRDDPG
jgi:NADP-dependent 3-hydroxy acid dehydrogenase YdfG